MSLLELKNICYAYDDIVALRYINLDINEGETVVLMGSNGCGKSTLLRLINGLCFANEGSYIFDGLEVTQNVLKDTKTSKQFHQKLGYIFQNAEIQLFCSNVEEEIQFGLVQMGLSENEVQQRTQDVLKLLDIEKLAHRAPYHLSGGEKRKVALAAILAMNPKVFILDEPIAALDHKSQIWLTQLLLELKRAGKTMIIATHNMDFAKQIADRIVYMSDEHELMNKYYDED